MRPPAWRLLMAKALGEANDALIAVTKADAAADEAGSAAGDSSPTPMLIATNAAMQELLVRILSAYIVFCV
jgi:hypothetical protein